MGTISINGRTFSGNNVDIVGGRVIIDGVEQTGDALSGRVDIIVVQGSITNLSTDASVHTGNITGDVRAGGSVNCNDVGGNVAAVGSVNCDTVGGSITAGGSVRHG